MYFNSNHAYSHGWLQLKPFKYETLLSQGLLNYFHVSQSLSNFTCSNIKTSSLGPSLDICDDEITRAEQKNITRPKTDKTETVSGDADGLGRTSGLQMTNFSYEWV